MRGILWKWLFTLGLIFWIALCVTDYYKKNIERHPKYLGNKYIEEDVIMLPLKKEPPALTFWKTLSMVLSVSALVYIKRSSGNKKYSKSNLMLTYPKHDDLKNFKSPPRIFKNLSVFPKTQTYCTDLKSNEISPDLYSNEPRRNIKNTLPTIMGVQLVQKKLENLERSVASLKQRHQGSTSGLISGSPEFRKFLSNQSIKSTTSDVSVISSHTSRSSRVPGSYLVTTTSSSEELIEQKVPQMLNSATSTTSIKNANNLTQTSSGENLKDAISVNLSGKTEDSSWSTISEEEASNTVDIESNNELDVSSFSPATLLPLTTITEESKLTEIYQKHESFSLTSKNSELTNTTEKISSNSLHSMQSILTDAIDLLDYEDDVQVPGSTLVSTSGNSSVHSSSTLMSISTNHIPMYYDETSCCSFEDDVLLNTLD